MCSRPIVSIYSGDGPFPVYCAGCWHGDKWDGEVFGREIDFTKPFFPQFEALADVVPRLALNNLKDENSEYCNQAISNRNCYLIFTVQNCDDCMYCHDIRQSTDVLNSSYLSACTLCFDCLECLDCYGCIHSQHLRGCSECWFSFDLIGCSNCFACAGLRNAKFCFQNRQCTPEEYGRLVQAEALGSRKNYLAWSDRFPEIRLQAPQKYAFLHNVEDCTGDCITDSKNLRESFQAHSSEDSAYAYNLRHQCFKIRDCSYVADARDCYQSMSVLGETLYLSTSIWYSSDIWYSDLCYYSQDLFGCVGLRRKNNLILNRQYEPAEYRLLRSRLVDHMKQTGEWGAIFPVKDSPFCYNETAAFDFEPLQKSVAAAKGWRWRDPDPKEYRPATAELPDNIAAAEEGICRETFACSRCAKNYRIQAAEFRRYKKAGVPLPSLCPNCRYLGQLELKNPQRLFNRSCARCKMELSSPYAPIRPERILCQRCYEIEIQA